ncbi:hypothetical protein PBRA_006054 [Plasmodiophora brassicae]|uniref:Mechanosensitive ion channel MscS domain-containing protein n=1 Tax=Plasmodiophora brassicae TaxID=37360 RepID=A0A0G4IRP5_PLABS|nr:hypothetical protein PBRA_006054 [Plasmodiophora brassicae]
MSMTSSSKALEYMLLREPPQNHRLTTDLDTIVTIDDEFDEDAAELERERTQPVRFWIRRNIIRVTIVVVSFAASAILFAVNHNSQERTEVETIIAIPGLLVVMMFASTATEALLVRIADYSSQDAADALRSRLRFVFFFGIMYRFMLWKWMYLLGMEDYAVVAVQIAKASFVVSVGVVLKQLLYGIVKKFAAVHALATDLRNMGALQDAMSMAAERKSFSAQLAAARNRSLVLPLKNVDGDWVFDESASCRIANSLQMRAIAHSQLKRVFGGATEINFEQWKKWFSSQTSAHRAWTLLFKDLPESSNLQSETFVWAFIQSLDRRIQLGNRMLNLDSLLGVICVAFDTVFFMAVGCYISIVLGFNFSAMVVTFATALASVTFALSGTLTRLFESMVWVFATKAIEVGDSIQMDQQDFVVVAIRLMSTELRSGDNRVLIVPNWTLAQTPIYNLRKTNAATVIIKFQVSYGCSKEDLLAVKRAIEAFVTRNPDTWRLPVDFRVMDLLDQTSLTVTAILRHRLNWQQKAIIMEDRFDVVSEIRSTINAMKIGYKDPDAYVDVKPRP